MSHAAGPAFDEALAPFAVAYAAQTSMRLRWARLPAVGAVAVALVACGGGSGGTPESVSGGSGVVSLVPAGPAVAAQVAPPSVTLPAAERRRYQAAKSGRAGGAPVILVYHDVQPDPTPPYTVAPGQLAAHLAVLHAAGFTPVNVAQVVAWLGGRRLPPRSVLVTFDDSTKGTWIYADPILAASKFRAVSFAITGWVATHQPYYLTWEELRHMQESGRWDLESHSRLGHQRLPIDASGAMAPALINRLWLPDQHRLESLDEFTERVRADLVGSRADLVEHGFPEPALFAYPFSAFTLPTNDPEAAARTVRLVHELFAAGLINSDATESAAPADARATTLRRVDVGTTTTNRQLFDLVTSSTALKPTRAGPSTVPTQDRNINPAG